MANICGEVCRSSQNISYGRLGTLGCEWTGVKSGKRLGFYLCENSIVVFPLEEPTVPILGRSTLKGNRELYYLPLRRIKAVVISIIVVDGPSRLSIAVC
jgi:hypothetical protein